MDVTRAAGIRFRHTTGASGRLYFPETIGSGGAFLDYNRDGRLDLLFVNGTHLPGDRSAPPHPTMALYEQQPGHRFRDVTRRAGLAVECYGIGCAVGDYNNDGFPDLYITALGPNHLFRNNGDGTFADVTRRAGVGDPRFSTSAAWLDFDRDGLLDLFVCNYCRWTPARNRLCPGKSTGRRCGPFAYDGERPTLYHNDGDGTFTDVTLETGLGSPAGKALGVAVWDFDDDGWPDLAVANDTEPNLLYHNEGGRRFREVGVERGLAFGPRGGARAGMGIDTGDAANDGREDVLIGNFPGEGLALYQPEARGQFTDAAGEAGLLQPSLLASTFGALFCDLDLDGRLDIVTANGHVDPDIGHNGGGITFAERLLLFRNEGGARFAEVGAQAGPVFREQRVWRGLAVGDFDGDGDPDLLLSTCGGRPALLRNDSGPGNHWLQLRPTGTASNRDGIGARIEVEAGGVKQRRWLRSGSSYASASELCAFFGLGPSAAVDRVTVRWPSGQVDTLENVRADRVLRLREASGARH